MKLYLILIVFIVILASCSQKSGQLDSFAQCLTDKGVTMYGTGWCSHCINQKGMFGKSFDYIDYVDCDGNPNACEIAGVTGYPTWTIDGSDYPGEQSLERLASLAACDLE